MTENKYLDGLDRIFRNTVDLWTQRGHQRPFDFCELDWLFRTRMPMLRRQDLL